MAPLSVAIQTETAFVRRDSTVYRATVDPEWTIAAVPHGGYIAALLLSALVQHQATTPHPDVAHLTIQFLSPSTPGEIQMEISNVSVSKRWTRLDLKSIQQTSTGLVTRCTAHALFTNLPDLSHSNLPTPTALTILPHTPSPMARTTPFISHPSQSTSNESIRIFNFKKRLHWSNGSKVPIVYETDNRLDWAGWVELTEDNKVDLRSSAVLVGFFADLFNNGLMKLPNDQQPGASWLPTLCLDIDFKVKFPLAIPSSSTSSPYAARTVGTYNRTDFIGAGRYQAITEVWTAPGELGEPRPVGETGDAWRKQMQILAVATQMALVVPAEVNTRKFVKTAKL